MIDLKGYNCINIKAETHILKRLKAKGVKKPSQ